MKYLEKYLEEVVRVKPLGEITVEDDTLNDLSGVYIYIDGRCSDIFVAHVDYLNWLESKIEL